MKILKQGAIAVGLLGLAACGGQTPAENVADNIEAASENQADILDDMAYNATNEVVESNLENQAAAVREAGENQADAVEQKAEADTNGM